MNDLEPPLQTVTNETPGAADTAARAWETTREKAGEALQTGERYVRENPGTSAVSLLGFGFLLGLLAGWSLAHEERDSYSASTRRFVKRWGHKLDLK